MRSRRLRSTRGHGLCAVLVLLAGGCGGGARHASPGRPSAASGAAGISAGGSPGASGTGGVAGTGASAGAGAAGLGASGAGGQGGAPAGAGGGLVGGAGAGFAGRPPATPRPVLSDLVIEPNPSNVLSCFVTWTSDVATSSEVQFGAGSYEFKISHDDSVTMHRVLVIGMHAETEYLIKAVSANQGGSTSLSGKFTTGSLPASVPLASVNVADPTAWLSGWTLVNVAPPDLAGATRGLGTQPGLVVMYDEGGAPVWYFQNGTTPDERGDLSLRPLGNGNLLLGPSSGEPPKEIDLAGDVVWQGPAQPPLVAGLPASDDPEAAPLSRYAGKLDNGNYVVLRENTANGISGAYIEELTAGNEVVWSWNLFEHLTPPADAAADWCHPNALTVDLTGDVFYLSCRFLGIIKAKRSGDQSIAWILGGRAGGSFTFATPDAAFTDQQDPELQSDGTILLYDDGSDQPARPAGVASRLLRLSFDETALTAKLAWQFPGSFAVDPWYTDHWYTPDWGDADRLVNGNVLATAGFRSGEQTRVFEVRATDGAVVFELTLPLGFGANQAERLAPPPLVVKL